MISNPVRTPAPKLSVCIATMNRARFIGATLDSIIPQLTEQCELVVLDGASSDETREILLEYSKRTDRLRYFRQETNNGLDQDYDRVVELACGRYCWLMTDDDLLSPGAIDRVLGAIEQRPSLVVINVESRNINMEKSESLHKRWLTMESDRVYPAGEMDRLFVEVGPVLRYIGCLIIEREIWRARDRQRHYGSLFNYLAVIFQEPLPRQTIVISDPLVSYRWGNSHGWSPKLFEALVIKFPLIVWSLPLSEIAKKRLCTAEPWRSAHELWYLRALGHYSWAEYHAWVRPRLRSVSERLVPILVASIPRVLANALFVAYYSGTGRPWRGVWEPEVVLQIMRQSAFNIRRWLSLKLSF